MKKNPQIKSVGFVILFRVEFIDGDTAEGRIVLPGSCPGSKLVSRL